MKTSEKSQRAEDREPGTQSDERRKAVCQALAEAHRDCPLLCERRGPSGERREPAPCCANCAYAARVPEGERILWICANTPKCPGCLACVRECEQCPNFRARRCPVVRGTPPEPPDDSIRFIPLTRGKFAIVDAGDYEWLSQYRWCTLGAGEHPYACRRENGKTIYMHRQIMQPPDGMCVDHIEGFTLDNRRANLRVCTPAENMRNRRGNLGRDLPKGVTWQRHCNKYKASIGCEGTPKHIGYYDDPIEAAKAYDRKARELFGEFARLNFPDASRQESVARATSLVSRPGEDSEATDDVWACGVPA
ncbi:MAG: HNH endonuclease [Phycisphaerae bacterium]|nr:HNH endonuclease [Phycisphaerae bacterium]